MTKLWKIWWNAEHGALAVWRSRHIYPLLQSPSAWCRPPPLWVSWGRGPRQRRETPLSSRTPVHPRTPPWKQQQQQIVYTAAKPEIITAWMDCNGFLMTNNNKKRSELKGCNGSCIRGEPSWSEAHSVHSMLMDARNLEPNFRSLPVNF